KSRSMATLAPATTSTPKAAALTIGRWALWIGLGLLVTRGGLLALGALGAGAALVSFFIFGERPYQTLLGWVAVTAIAIPFVRFFLGVLAVCERILGFQLATLSGGEVRLETNNLVRVSGPYPVPEILVVVLVICLGATLYWMQQSGRTAYPKGAIAVGFEL